MEQLNSKLLLVEQAGDDGRTATVDKSLFTVGRSVGMDLQIENRVVSSRHAIIRWKDSQWLLEDLGSTNGTFVNGEKITEPREIRENDLIHFARIAYRVAGAVEGGVSKTKLVGITSEISGAMDLVEVLEQGGAYSVFQPIYEVSSGKPVAFEALGRGIARGSRLSPANMFSMAELEHRTAHLSRVLCDAAMDCLRCGHCWSAHPEIEIWINLHPSQITVEGLPDDLRGIADAAAVGGYRVVIEAPETWVNRTDEMQQLVQIVRSFGMRVAYDDFGAGQARLQDLMSNPPDYLKFDRLLVENLAADTVKQEILRAMVKACDSLGVATLAEGIEEQTELDACRELGISMVQGYLLERPLQAYDLFRAPVPSLPSHCQHRRLGMV